MPPITGSVTVPLRVPPPGLLEMTSVTLEVQSLVTRLPNASTTSTVTAGADRHAGRRVGRLLREGQVDGGTAGRTLKLLEVARRSGSRRWRPGCSPGPRCRWSGR